MPHTEVVVAIPIYKKEFSDLEMRSLRQVYSILLTHQIVIVKPQSLDIDFLLDEFPLLSFISFDNFYFQGIKGYNHLMLSSQFYKEFLFSNYILIYQLDAYVFRDELLEWCAKGYDYIGAPWLRKPKHNRPFIKQYMDIIHWYKLRRGKPSRQSVFNKTGNGGLSLRKVESHYQATQIHKEKIAFYLSQERSHFYNEDVFWAIEIPTFTYPSPLEALKFSFEKQPDYCYELNQKELPFGCHAWYKRKMCDFWKPIIGF